MPIFGRKSDKQEAEAPTFESEPYAEDSKGDVGLEEEQAVLEQYLDGEQGQEVPQMPSLDLAQEEQEDLVPAEDDDDGTDDLMDIFTSEEVEDEDLSSLTRDLPPVEAESLLSLGREVLRLLEDTVRRR